MTEPESVSDLLRAWGDGDAEAGNRLMPLVYRDLKRRAGAYMGQERPDHTLQPTALVHEAFLRLLGGTPPNFESRTHFLRAASQTMRRVLVDHARARSAAKRGGGLSITLDDAVATDGEATVDMLVLDDALTRLADAEPRWAQVVELRFFAGLEVPEVADTLGISTATVKRDWRFARAWLARELDLDPGPREP